MKTPLVLLTLWFALLLLPLTGIFDADAQSSVTQNQVLCTCEAAWPPAPSNVVNEVIFTTGSTWLDKEEFIYTVPAGKSLYLTRLRTSTNFGGDATWLETRPVGGGAGTWFWGDDPTGVSDGIWPGEFPSYVTAGAFDVIVVPPNRELWMRTDVTYPNSNETIHIFGYLMDN